MADVADNYMLEDSDNEVDFTDINNLCLAYQKGISNNGMIASVYKIMKINYKNASKKLN